MQGVLSSLFTAVSQVSGIVPGLYEAPCGYLLNDLHMRSETQFLEYSLQLPCFHKIARARMGLLDLSVILQIAPFPKSCRIHPFFEDKTHLQ